MATPALPWPLSPEVSEALLQATRLPGTGPPAAPHGLPAAPHGIQAAPHALGNPPWEERPVRFEAQVVLTKEEAFGACQALADAGRVLVRSGEPAQSDLLCSLFALIEERLVTR